MVSRALKRAGIKEVLIHSNQHYSPELSQIFLNEFAIHPDYNLNTLRSTPNQQTAAILITLEPILIKEKPDIVLVYGDCSTTLAAALCAAKLKIPVAHVEAGPRQYDMTIPEEINRVLTDHLSTYCFAPTSHCIENLKKESLRGLCLSGDVMLDLFLHFQPTITETPDYHDILVTIHRPINTDNPDRLISILNALEKIAKKATVLFPIHPRTRQSIEKNRIASGLAGSIHFHEPLSYIQTLAFLKGVKLVITDSGGLQKEAFFACVPCLTLDTTSPWPETVQAGWNRVVRPDELVEMAKNPPIGKTHDISIFGDGHAAEKIAEVLLK
jgi:UDP-N-acetylglucosamine 2-epimerase (non-hydrolysing)